MVFFSLQIASFPLSLGEVEEEVTCFRDGVDGQTCHSAELLMDHLHELHFHVYPGHTLINCTFLPENWIKHETELETLELKTGITATYLSCKCKQI